MLEKAILKLFSENRWKKEWVVITELVVAESTSIIISNSAKGKIELKATANIEAPSFDIADANFQFAPSFSRGLETKIVSAEGLPPLFKAMGIKDKLFASPEVIVKSRELNDSISVETDKDDYYFDYISLDL